MTRATFVWGLDSFDLRKVNILSHISRPTALNAEQELRLIYREYKGKADRYVYFANFTRKQKYYQHLQNAGWKQADWAFPFYHPTPAFQAERISTFALSIATTIYFFKVDSSTN